MVVQPAVYDFAAGEGSDYTFPLFVLFCSLNCNMLVYVLYRILPAYGFVPVCTGLLGFLRLI